MDKDATRKLSYGLYVLGVKTDRGFGGQIIDAVAQVSMAEKPNIIVSSQKVNYSNEMIKKYGELTLSVLGANFNPFVVANFGFQSGRDVDKWANVAHSIADGLPVLSEGIAHLRLKVIGNTELETHTLFLTEVQDAWLGENKAEPLIYADYLNNHKDAAMEAFKKFNEENAS